MLHWQEIPGWSEDIERLYDHVTKTCADDATLVEVGVWFGRSVVMLGQKLLELGKADVKVFAVDSFTGSDGVTPEMRATIDAMGGSYLKLFEVNLRKALVDRVVRPVQGDSAGAAEQFVDGEVDFVFIDADHRYEAVKRDILAWLPKVKRGGVIAGHDFLDPDVNRAVKELLPSAASCGQVWVKVIA